VIFNKIVANRANHTRKRVAKNIQTIIAFFLSFSGRFLVAIQIIIALSPLITISMMIIFKRARAQAMVNKW
jgi:hypothetical protein